MKIVLSKNDVNDVKFPCSEYSYSFRFYCKYLFFKYFVLHLFFNIQLTLIK